MKTHFRDISKESLMLLAGSLIHIEEDARFVVKSSFPIALLPLFCYTHLHAHRKNASFMVSFPHTGLYPDRLLFAAGVGGVALVNGGAAHSFGDGAAGVYPLQHQQSVGGRYP